VVRPERGSVPVGDDGILDRGLVDGNLHVHVPAGTILVHALTGALLTRRWSALFAALLFFAVQDTRFADSPVVLGWIRRWAFYDVERLNAAGRIDGNLPCRTGRNGSSREEGEDEQGLTTKTKEEVYYVQLTLS
jgi:hypothetical protein